MYPSWWICKVKTSNDPHALNPMNAHNVDDTGECEEVGEDSGIIVIRADAEGAGHVERWLSTVVNQTPMACPPVITCVSLDFSFHLLETWGKS